MRWSLVLALALAGCGTVPPAVQRDALHGLASWYGEEFAGRTTANGEIFDPLLFTAAHRTLPFGTVVDVTNTATKRTVRVRINDRGPYVGARLIDLSYAAAQQIGLVEPGSGIVDLAVVRLGRGEREPPAPYVVDVDVPAAKATIASAEPPQISFPLPTQVAAGDDFRVEVVQERAGVVTRKQVSADGKTIEEVPIGEASMERRPVPAAVVKPPPAPAPREVARRPTRFVVQVGAFTVEANAKSLQERLTRIGQASYIDRDDLYRVRIGPFASRDLAVRARTSLETNGLSAMVVAE